MSSNYVIRWKSKVNGRAGRGTKCFERAEAERLTQELNHEYPQIEHETVKMSSPPTDQAAKKTADKSSYALTE